MLWASVQERDGLGDDLVPDFFTHIQQGGFYGGLMLTSDLTRTPNKGQRPDLVAKTIVPDLSLGAHTAVIDWEFYTGKQFPSAYNGGAFFALHGSSNREKRVGYSVVFVPFKSGKPAGRPQDFLTGWMLGEDKREVWGRPTGVTMTRDGGLLVSDDGGNRIWRVFIRNSRTEIETYQNASSLLIRLRYTEDETWYEIHVPLPIYPRDLRRSRS